MPRSRGNPNRHKPDGRMAKRLEKMSQQLEASNYLNVLMEEALKGIGLQAWYSPDPVPHIELRKLDAAAE